MIKSFFESKSLALVGASSNIEKLGFKILQNIVESGYRGKIYPVNPKADSILDIKCYKDIAVLPEPPELAIIVIPASRVAAVVEELGRKGTGAIVVISAGFKEAGEEGVQREEELKKIVKKYNIRLIGPNCLGIIDTVNNINASFAFEAPPRGNISFITQSGAIGTAVLDWSAKEGMGMAKFVSFGNMADVSETDLLEYFGDDPDTSVILLYLEGLQDGKKFMESAKKVAMKKPIIMLKSGRSSAGSKAVASHTGSIAGSDSAYNAAFLQSGVIRAESMQELFDSAILFSYQPLLKKEKISILTNAGGPGVITVDTIEKERMSLASLSEDTKNRLRKILPAAASVNNPVDVLGDSLAETYAKALEIIFADSETDAVIAILSPQVITQIPETAQRTADISRKYEKPLVTSFIGGKRMEEGSRLLSKNKIPNYSFPERGVEALKNMFKYRTWVEKEKGTVSNPGIDKEKIQSIFAEARNRNGKEIGDIEGRKILRYCGINTVESFLAVTREEAVSFYEKTGDAVVMKLVSPQILHKTEAGGVKVGIKGADAISQSFNEIIASAKNYNKDAAIEGVQIQPMIEGGLEVIIGVKSDPHFGHLIMFGLGGIYVELLKDVSFRIAPLTDVDAEEMISEIKTAGLLKGFRNTPERDIPAIKSVIVRISQLCCDFPQIEEMDINPLMVMDKGKGAIAVDARFALTD